MVISIDKEINSLTFGKPNIFLFHDDSSKGGVDTVDMNEETYSVTRITNRWPMRTIVYTMLGIAGLNSFILVIENLKTPQKIQ